MVPQQNQIKVRFAPSPTGHLHLGSARTALYNFLFARHKQGVFVLRIEDTDPARSKQKYLEGILQELKWLGLDWDEGPYFQSQRRDIYNRFARQLLDQDKAYISNGAIKFKIQPERICFNDLIHGRMDFDNSLLEDLVIIKSDGLPAYNFACVVDDIQMGITHVIRGDDHISNTPKQVALYKALGASIPIFAHIPLILGPDRSPLSKRHGASSIDVYRRQGYLPEAIINYLALLGWSPGGNQELMSLDKMIEKFNLKKVNKTSAIFNPDKLKWMNGEYIRRLPLEQFAERIIPVLESAGFTENLNDRKWLTLFCSLYQKRIKTLTEITDAAGYFFIDKIDYDPQAKEKYLCKDKVGFLLERWAKELDKLENFEPESIEASCRQLASQMNIPAAEIIHPARVALTGRSASPGLFEVVALLGREKAVRRLTKV